MDLILDFANAAGNDDTIGTLARGFGIGLAANTWLGAWPFQTRFDNLAQDSNDRFIFCLTDWTLWLDADGKGGAASVLLADLQAGAAVTAADNWLA